MEKIKEPYNQIIAGVGGQGNILASALAGIAATKAGFNVVVGETYGASQRGGSVMSHVRLSREKTYGPLVPSGQADLIVAFEPLEALRVASKYANGSTTIIVNPAPVYPVSVALKEASYPEIKDILKALKSLAGDVFTVNATLIARDVATPKAQNIVMINAMSHYHGQPIQRSYYNEALEEFLQGAGLEQKEANKKAFLADLTLEQYN